jgi:hypothetical protein
MDGTQLMAGKTNLDAITDFPGLLTYLEDELDWPIDAATFEEATFEYTPAELGLKEDVVGGAVEIKQLRPLVSGQPWGVFFLNLPHKRLPQTIVRNILGRLTVKKRAASNDPGRPAFLKSDLLFITSTGAGEERRLAFAHFQDDPQGGNAATLKVLGWDEFDTPRRLKLTEGTLAEKLHWPDDPSDVVQWRKQWAEAFFRRDTRTVVRDSITMAKALAALARRIRARAAELISAQTAMGSLVKLHAAFKAALIHDLTPAGFADTYAQTIAYGLLSTAISRTSGALTQDDMTANVAGTSPFLKEMLGTFIEAGGRRGGHADASLDFDELGVAEVVELLRNADMEAVLADFDRKNPDEDPVIHFYELFLKEYDAEQKVKRGVFYTPRPVVGFIVRSVDEVLKKEFGLADGLASTATWADMIAAKPEIKLPAGAKLDDPFVRILDPATGTGTFLVECVDLIHKTMVAKWKAGGKRDAEIKNLWNDYVPKHLLPRLTGFELMMAPYAIAHVKLGLKLSDTGYRFGSDARAQIYLTNALEPPKDFATEFAFVSEALAHEAKAANGAKRTKFTCVVGNPPYSGASSNMSQEARSLVDKYRSIDGEPLGERKIWVQNDYIKFLSLAENIVNQSGAGILSFITDNSFTDGPTFRGVRYSLLSTFGKRWLVDLGGKSTVISLSGQDDNVFDIQQGVAVFTGMRRPGPSETRSIRIKGARTEKYRTLNSGGFSMLSMSRTDPRPKLYDFYSAPKVSTEVEYEKFAHMGEIFNLICTGVQTSRDHIAVGFQHAELLDSIEKFSSASLSDEDARSSYFPGKAEKKLPAGDTRQWNLVTARKGLRTYVAWREALSGICYRPYDDRVFCASELISDWPRPELGAAMSLSGNIALLTVRRTENEGAFAYSFVTSSPLSNHSLSSKDGTYGLPLNIPDPLSKANPIPNINRALAIRVGKLTNLGWDDCIETPKQGALAGVVRPIPTQEVMFVERRERGDLKLTFGPRDLFDWIYAILHSPTYRSRYAEYLKSDFARIPLPKDRRVFKALIPFGSMLVALHLLDTKVAPGLIDPKSVRLAGSGDNRVFRKAADFENDAWEGGRMYISPTQWFETVPERVANFHIGGYRPARKWLKDRTASGGKHPSLGRVLTSEDILHYRRMIVAMDKTIDVMAKIDTVIDEHGGWPDAFRGMTD